MVKYQRQFEDGDDKAEDANDVAVVDAIPSERRCFGDGFKVLVLGIVIFCAAITIGLLVDIYYLRIKDACVGCPKNIGVVTDAPECTIIATNILKQNDNAIDATIGAIVCLAVIRPDQCSLASGGYLLLHHNGKNKYLDFEFMAPNITRLQPKTNVVAIPGLLAGLRKAHVQYGSLPFSQLIEPSIKLATNGFVVANSTAAYIRKLPQDAKHKFVVNGKLVEPGEKLKMPNLAETLRQLSKGSYSLAKDVARATNGSISVKDFMQYNSKLMWKKPLVINMSGKKVISTGVPSSGGLLLSALNILNEFNGMGPAQTYNAIAETLKIILPRKDELEDPAFNTSQKDLVQELLNVSMAKYNAAKIKSKIKMVPKVLNTQVVKKKSSVAVSIINLQGDAVSVVSSLGDVFGSGRITESGIVLNNGLSMFSANKKVNNMESFKRPVSASSPAFILNDPMISLFTPSTDDEGLASVVQVIRNRLVGLLNEQESIEYPRVFFDKGEDQLVIEGNRFSKYGLNDVVTSLKSQYQNIREVESIGSVSMVVSRNVTRAIMDPR